MALTIGMPIYPTVDTIDVAGPWDIFSRIPRFAPSLTVDLILLAESLDCVTSGQGLQLTPSSTFDASPTLDVLFVPGTQTLDAILPNRTYIEFIKRHGATAKYVVAVCTGAVIAAEAGLLDGHRATTHWAAMDKLRTYPRVTVANGYPRYVECGNRLTTGGVSSSLDGALYFVQMLTGSPVAARCIQLEIQYNPHPPYIGGDPAVADFETYEMVNGTPHPPACGA